MWNGVARPTTFINGTTLQVTDGYGPADGTGQIAINNPGPGGSTTTPTELVVAATVPTISSINPSSVTVNTSSNVPTSVGIVGSGFCRKRDSSGEWPIRSGIHPERYGYLLSPFQPVSLRPPAQSKS